MLRRQTRERREYIYKKALESKEKQIYQRKQAIREALASGKPLPASLSGGEAAELGRDLNLDAAQAAPGTSIDDEYSRSGTYDPRVLVTTSRDPSSKLTQFAKEVRLLFPNSTRLNRGGYTVSDLAAAARSNGITDMVVLHEHRGVPDAMVISHFPHGPTLLFTLHNVVLRHEVSSSNSTVSEQYPHLIFENFTSNLGTRVATALKKPLAHPPSTIAPAQCPGSTTTTLSASDTTSLSKLPTERSNSQKLAPDSKQESTTSNRAPSTNPTPIQNGS